MSIEAVARTLTAPLGGSGKLVLVGLANHAHPDGTNAYPAVPTLARYAYCDPRTVQRNLRALERREWIAQTGVMPDGRVIYRLRFAVWETELATIDEALEGGNLPPRQIVTPAATMPGDPPASLPPKPSVNRQSILEESSVARDAAEDRTDLELWETAEHVRGVLQRGIDGLTTDEPCKAPGAGVIRAALERFPVDAQTARLIAVEVRAIAQSQNRAPNIAGLYAQRLQAASSAVDRSERDSQPALSR